LSFRILKGGAEICAAFSLLEIFAYLKNMLPQRKAVGENSMERSGMNNLRNGNYIEFQDISDGFYLCPRQKAVGVNLANSK